MSGGGTIIEKAPHRFSGAAKSCVRYRVMQTDSHDETFVCAAPADDEPSVGDVIWWGGAPVIYWGENDSKQLTKVGYSWRAE